MDPWKNSQLFTQSNWAFLVLASSCHTGFIPLRGTCAVTPWFCGCAYSFTERHVFPSYLFSGCN